MSDHDLYAIAEAHLRTIRDIERDLAAERARVKRLRESEAKMATLVRLASGPHAPQDVVDGSIALARRGLLPGDLDDREARS